MGLLVLWKKTICRIDIGGALYNSFLHAPYTVNVYIYKLYRRNYKLYRKSFNRPLLSAILGRTKSNENKYKACTDLFYKCCKKVLLKIDISYED